MFADGVLVYLSFFKSARSFAGTSCTNGSGKVIHTEVKIGIERLRVGEGGE